MEERSINEFKQISIDLGNPEHVELLQRFQLG
jgi:hypothetical protein